MNNKIISNFRIILNMTFEVRDFLRPKTLKINQITI